MEITDSPHRPGTTEHNEWVRSVFIPTVSPERMLTDRAKYGAEAIGRNFVRGEKIFDNPARSGIFLRGAFKVMGSSAFAAANVLQSFAGLFSDRDIKAMQDEERRRDQDRMWLDVPAWAWHSMSETQRAFCGMVRTTSGRGPEFDLYYDHGRLMPMHGPPKPPENRATRRMATRPPLRPQPECPRHGGPAYKCGPCQRSSHARR
jgi:hypothetical protein